MYSLNAVLLLACFSCLAFSTQITDSIAASNLLGSFFPPPGFNASFDYVVVGAGTAGLALATRLAEAGQHVAVIEAGGYTQFDNGNYTAIPSYAGYFIGTDPLISNPRIDWGDRTLSMQGLGGKSIAYAQGKAIGGTSTRNYMIYNRGTYGSHQKWADAVGDNEYLFDNFLPYYKNSTTLDVPDPTRPANASYTPSSAPYGSSGPQHVTYSPWVNAWGSWGARALNELGLGQVADFVSGRMIGWQYCAFLIEKNTMTRSSSAAGYLERALGKGLPLAVYKSTLAKRIDFDTSCSPPQAKSVEVESLGVKWTLSATKEVIVSAGAFRSPQLLMVSGVGPADQLKRLNVPVVKDLPGIGQNMQDQPFFGPSWEVNLLTHSNLAASPPFLAQQIYNYNNNRTGQLTNVGEDFLAFEKLPAALRKNMSAHTQQSLAAYPADWPEVEYVFGDVYVGTAKDMVLTPPMDGKQYVTITGTILTPFSRGNVTLNSTDTAQKPLVNPNFLGDDRDKEQAVAIYRRLREIFAANSMKPVLIGTEAYPGLNVTTDSQILDTISASLSTIWHASATCKMGKSHDPMAVVDPKARVYGIKGLRVVDASAFPFLPPVHPSATLYALAEKIAKDILTGA